MTEYTIGIIGGTGSMGQWFNSFFTEAGYRVLISGRKTTIT
ncbi:MAG: prephenate dehydrogenase/arogenate dehydrogenase family protein, partial [Deltaproteobacteria bacterium]|nr:prephenate dehydrogenase/arogenate dehydrogenase family protein [Deltaproteobacteria bacterium]